MRRKESKLTIEKDWAITETEFEKLESKFGQLCEFQAWQLYRKNSRLSHTDEQVDIAQRLRIALMRAASYYKRQTYIKRCLELCTKYAYDEFTNSMVASLQNLWDNKTRHGANRQKFGPHQEKMLARLTRKLVPKKLIPDRHAELTIDEVFAAYCKSVTWNELKAMGKEISREKAIRSNLVSLSEFDYFAS